MCLLISWKNIVLNEIMIVVTLFCILIMNFIYDQM